MNIQIYMNKNSNFIAFFYLLLWITSLVDGLSLGIQVAPSIEGSTDLLTEINSIHEELYTLNNLISNTWSSSSYKKNIEKIKSLHKQIDLTVNDYILKNTCLRYYLNEYISYSDLKSKMDDGGLLVSLNFKFGGLDNQIFNINILDKDANTLRKINQIKENTLRLLIDYPINDKNEEIYKQHYFDLCFENFKYDKSWSSTISLIKVYLELSFGIETISEKYAKSSNLITSVKSDLDKIYKEVETITNDIIKNLKTLEPALRDKNENTLTLYMISIIIILVIYLIVNFTQLYWLIKYLRNKRLIN